MKKQMKPVEVVVTAAVIRVQRDQQEIFSTLCHKMRVAPQSVRDEANTAVGMRRLHLWLASLLSQHWQREYLQQLLRHPEL